MILQGSRFFESDNVLGKINEDPGELKVSEQKMDRQVQVGSKNKQPNTGKVNAKNTVLATSN